ncbi:MAG: tetratricopeptide repeat protein [Firmicutes bacterium]|nr:tetratricopeptide repeat protein [Bacillota bacterium]
MPQAERILATKLLAPRSGVTLVERPRLLDKLAQAQAQTKRLTLITAPAGYGKTVLLAQYAAQLQTPVVWYQLDNFDNDLALFSQYLVAGIEQHYPDFGTEITQVLEQSRDVDKDLRRLTAAFVNTLAVNVTDSLLLILDDYHLITANTVHGFMEQFMDYLPQNVHVMIASRTTPPLQLERLKVAGLLETLNLEALCFRTEEIASFLTTEQQPVSAEMVAFLEEETGGWPAVLRLANFSLPQVKHRQQQLSKRSLAHRKDIYHYFAAEVLNNLPADLVEFMLATAVLDLITPEICDLFLKRENSYVQLEQLEAQNLFTTVLDAEGVIYRYHHLFRDFLQSRLGEKRNQLVRKAGQCYLQAGYPTHAVEYFLAAADYEQAVLAIEKVGSKMLLHSRWQTIQRWLQCIPEEYKVQQPWMLLFAGAVSLNSGHLNQAEALIFRAEQRFSEAQQHDGILQALLYRARILRSRGDYSASLQLLQPILPELRQRPIREWYDVALEHSLLLGLRGELEQVNTLLNEALTQAEREGEDRIAAQLTERLCDIYFVKGEYAKAVSIHQRAAELASAQERLSFLERDSIATIYHDWGDLDQALEYALDSVKAKEKYGLTEALPYAYQQLAFVQTSLGQYQEAEENYQRSITLTEQLGGETFFKARSLALYGRFLAARGRLQEAQPLAEEALALAKEQSAFIYAVCLQAAAPVYIQLGEMALAAEMLEQALEILEQVGAKYSQCVTCALLALVYRQQSKQTAAEKMAIRCLELAAPENCLQLFVGNAEMMLPVLEVGLIKGLEPEFIGEALQRLGTEAAEMLIALTNHSNAAVRLRVIQLLTRLGGVEVAKAIEVLLHDNDEEVRDAALVAMQTLTKIQAPQGITDESVQEPVQKIGSKRQLEVKCLSRFQAFCAGTELQWRTTKAKELFAYLIHQRGRAVSKERILDDLWPELDTEQASTIFHTNLYQLRKTIKTAIGEQPVQHKGGQYTLEQSKISCDLEQFELLATTPEEETNLSILEEALSLYQDEYLAGLEYEWVYAERERLSQIYQSLLKRLAHAYLHTERLNQAAACLRSLLQVNPLLEEAHALLMTVYARLGDRMAVLQQYETLSQVLAEELGIDPSSKTRKLYYKLCSNQDD